MTLADNRSGSLTSETAVWLCELVCSVHLCTLENKKCPLFADFPGLDSFLWKNRFRVSFFDAHMPSSMCGCRGIRTCALCDKDKLTAEVGIPFLVIFSSVLQPCNVNETSFIFCNTCSRASCGNHICNTADNFSFSFTSVTVVPDFVTAEEEKFLLKEIDANSWYVSQSGRRKQVSSPQYPP